MDDFFTGKNGVIKIAVYLYGFYACVRPPKNVAL